MRQAIILILATAGIIIAAAMPTQARDIPFTQEDRDRIIRLEEGQKAINQRIDDMNKRFEDMNRRFEDTNRRLDDMNRRLDDMNKRLDQMMTLILWGFGILFGGMGLLLGFVLWDRRTALAPAIRKTKEVDEQAQLLVKAIKEVAEKNQDVKEALKHAGLM
ncbi:MAG: hypothetical protein HQL06_04055 [Nitrospirae bacterium]|nr:hypothetical protein [Nitrospirota bacterium]